MITLIYRDSWGAFAHVVPIKSKQEGDVASGMIECLNKMGKKPQTVYTDDDGALNQEAIRKYLKDENIEHHRTRAHPILSERAIRTFKDMLYKRVKAEKKKTEHPMDRVHIRNNINIESPHDTLGNGIYAKRSPRTQ